VPGGVENRLFPKKPDTIGSPLNYKVGMSIFDQTTILSPKRGRRDAVGWHGFFPYYAGYPIDFALQAIQTTKLDPRDVIFDPWNGSGTTTFAANQAGFASAGSDINPVMVIVAKARLLPSTEADTLMPLATRILESARNLDVDIRDDLLVQWFAPTSATAFRSIERAIASHTVTLNSETGAATDIGGVSCLAAAFYVALFSVVRTFASAFRTSNPTWIRPPKEKSDRAAPRPADVFRTFKETVYSMRVGLTEAAGSRRDANVGMRIFAGDATHECAMQEVGLVLTSPPYCTRIDYAAATRLELALLNNLVATNADALRRALTGSVLTPRQAIMTQKEWGQTCLNFISAVENHSSRASRTYYLNTHLDYFSKLYRSLKNLASSVREGGGAILVVQDSHYKEVHNDLPKIVTEMAQSMSLSCALRADFEASRNMAAINTRSRNYRGKVKAVESVLCFDRV
jgi:SAM-dependent methyltransferase